ncbi:DUF1638 domain-containing protein [Chloroflexota bacterium]
MPEKTRNSTRIIACAVFKQALEHLQLGKRYPNLHLTYLPSNLHLKPQELRSRLIKETNAAIKRGERVICLYGDCFPDIDDFCQQRSVTKVEGHYCYEMLLGSERFTQIIDETAGTYFAEKDLIQNFEEYCVRPLELNDKDMRKYCFKQYRRLLYVRQPSDSNLVPKASEVAKFLELSLDISDADYSHLGNKLIKLL